MAGTSRRLAVLIPSMGGGGAERVVVNLLEGFVRHGLQVDLVLVRPEGPLMDCVPPEVRIVPLRGGRVLASLPSLIGYLRRTRPDALLSHLDSTNVLALVARRLSGVSTRIVVTTHIALSQHAGGGSLRQRVIARLVPHLYPWADAVVGVSRGVADDLERIIGPGHLEAKVVYNPVMAVSASRASEVLEESRPLSGDAGFEEGARIVLSVGRLTRQKNQALLIEAFAIASQRDGRLRLVLLGEGPERGSLEMRADELGLSDKVRMPGYVEDTAPYYRMASVFVLSSDWEGLPTVIIEALSFGCPVVSTNCPSGPEEILEGGVYGRLVPRGDKDAMARAILQTTQDPPDPELLKRRAGDFGMEPSVNAYLDLLFPKAKISGRSDDPMKRSSTGT